MQTSIKSRSQSITSTCRRSLVAGAILSALTLSIATASRADDGTAPPQVVVKFADLDVSTSPGAAALYSRIHRAAEDVCSRMYPIEQAYKWHKNACLQKVIGDAVIKVNRPALTAVFASKYGVSPTVLLAEVGAR